MADDEIKTKHFIEQRIEADIANNTYQGQVITRFPPEPNGYLHVGHAKSICLNFDMAKAYQGRCHLRYDDTNPSKEEREYMDAIQEDIRWLGYQWDSLHHTADYFDQLYDYAVALIKQGKAYVCSLSAEEIRDYRGSLTQAGRESPYRERTIDENLDLFSRMKAGEFADGEHVLRAKIDMSSGNINMRDPVIYRIMHEAHPHTGDKWCVYPMYDFAHCLSDSIENITHSLCTLEFQDHRPLYDWLLEHLTDTPRPQQIEFSRLNLSHMITSKRKLKRLVDEGHVSGWNDPRMPTLAGLRRRGFTPAGIHRLCELVGISRSDSVIDLSLLEECVRDDLNVRAARALCVLQPLKITIENLPVDHCEMLTAANHPQNSDMGERQIPFTRELYIERDDFMMEAPKKYKRLAPGKEVRLRHAYVIKCERVITDDDGEIVELICSYDENTLGKNPEDRKVKGGIHWVSATQAQHCQVRLYDRLFMDENPGATDDWLDKINEHSLTVLQDCYVEPAIAGVTGICHFQFERLGYFVTDSEEHKANQPVFNRVVSLRDSWAKLQK